MIWRQVPSYPIYEASDEGQIRIIKTQSPLITHLTSGGYRAFRLHNYGREVTVHRLVCEAFHGPSDLSTDHIDGNKLNNRPVNLQWLTPAENFSKANIGRAFTKKAKANMRAAQHGENNPTAIFTEAEVSTIKHQLTHGIFCSELARKYNVPLATIKNIKQGTNWKYVK